MKSPLNETAWQRANKDAMLAFRTFRFWLFDLLAGAIFTLIVLRWTPSWVSSEWKIIYQVFVPVFVIFIGLAILYFVSLIKAPYLQRNEARARVQTLEDKSAPCVSVEPCVGRRQADYERTEHLMWAELQVTNMSNQPLKNVGVNIVTCLTVQEKQNSPSGNDYLVWDFLNWHQTSAYWSERNAQPQQLELTIPTGATRVSLVAFQDNSNGGQFVFNSPNHEWVVGGVTIDVEISSSTAVMWKGSYYIECHPNYLGGDRAKFEFLEWDKWVNNRNIILLEPDKEKSQTE